LSPIQLAAYRWIPAKPARDSTNVRLSGMASSRPWVVPMAMRSAYWLWNLSWDCVPWSKRIRPGSMLPVAGSFMSFQIPARPDCTCAAFNSPHQARASSVAKSGKAVSPGQTWPM
jgi:hypothetical protein